jgi:hypothetical protein
VDDEKEIDMLGEELGSEQGQITMRRVLPSEGHGARMEVSFEASGTLAGVQVNDIGTYVAEARPDGTLQGEGQGVIMSADGEMATWRGQGAGRPGAGGAVSYRGAIYFESPTPKLSRLNGIAVLYEFEVAADGKAESKLWEWK